MTAQVMQVDSRRRISGDEVWELAATEYHRMLELLRTLGDGDWTRPTDCTAWDVRAMLGHLVGAAEGFANPAEMVHQYRLGAKLLKSGEADGHLPVDGANAVQVQERADRRLRAGRRARIDALGRARRLPDGEEIELLGWVGGDERAEQGHEQDDDDDRRDQTAVVHFLSDSFGRRDHEGGAAHFDDGDLDMRGHAPRSGGDREPAPQPDPRQSVATL